MPIGSQLKRRLAETFSGAAFGSNVAVSVCRKKCQSMLLKSITCEDAAAAALCAPGAGRSSRALSFLADSSEYEYILSPSSYLIVYLFGWQCLRRKIHCLLWEVPYPRVLYVSVWPQYYRVIHSTLCIRPLAYYMTNGNLSSTHESAGHMSVIITNIVIITNMLLRQTCQLILSL